MIQALALIAVLAGLAFAVLESGRLAARAGLERFAAQATDAALHEAVVGFTSDVRAIVAAQGTRGPWPAREAADPFPHGAGAPAPLCPAATAPEACPFSYSAAWTIDGATGAAGSAAGPALAANLQRTLIDEERLAGSVTVRLTDRGGRLVAARTRLLTLRVFGATPYAIVAGARDAPVLAGTLTAAQGDTGGTPARNGGGTLADLPSPDPANPDRYRDTRIKVEMDCLEAGPGASETDPFADTAPAGDDGLPWGVSGRAFETPCAPAYAAQITENAPAGVPYPANPYPIDAFAPSSWTTGDNPGGAWAP